MVNEAALKWVVMPGQMEGASLLFGGADARTGTERWLVFLPGDVFLTVDVPRRGPAVPSVRRATFFAIAAALQEAARRSEADVELAQAMAEVHSLFGGSVGPAAET